MRTFLRILLPIIVLLGGVGIAYLIIHISKPPKHQKAVRQSYLVRVMRPEKKDQVVYIETQAEAKTGHELPIVSQVQGRVVWVKSGLTEGAKVLKGDILFKIDQSDYAIGLMRSKASVSAAKLKLEQTQAQKKLALAGADAVEGLNIGIKSKLSSLALYEPQIKAAKIAVLSAQADLKQAKLNLSRTIIKAPFSGYVHNINLSIGQMIGLGSPIGTLVPVSPMYVTASVPIRSLPYIVSQEEDKNKVSQVVLTKTTPYKKYTWHGIVVRKMNRMEAAGRMANLYIRIDDVKTKDGQILPVDLFLSVSISGKVLYNVISVPYYTLHNKSYVWVKTKDDKLAFKKVTPIYASNHKVYLKDGISEDDDIITSALSPAVEGEKLKVVK